VEKRKTDGRPEPNRNAKWPDRILKMLTTKKDKQKTVLKVVKTTTTIPTRPIRKRKAKMVSHLLLRNYSFANINRLISFYQSWK
jgi:SOS response regulatory protein OraA/RecX